MRLLPKKLLAFVLIFYAKQTLAQAPSQSLPFDTLKLETLTELKSGAANWHIAGNVSSDRRKTGDLSETKGKGILVFKPTKNGSKRLDTRLDFGDADIEMDFLLAKGASFQVMIHDRYPVKISDEWMRKTNPGAKAPGLWQHLSMQFKAPVLDNNGNETISAQLVKIRLNDQEFSNHAEPKSKIAINPASKSLTVTGNDLPFAIRNIRYKSYEPDRIQVFTTTFKVYAGLHKNPDTLALLQPKRTGRTDTLSHLVGDRKSQLMMEGMLDIPRDGDYLFKLIAGGGAWFYIDGKEVINNRGTRDFERAFYAKHNLKKGKYPFKIIYSNSDECLVLHYEGPKIPWQSLTTPASVRLSERFEPLEFAVTSRPVIQRGFMMHGDKVNPYAASAGIPATAKEQSGNNYAYDMKRFNLLAAWHGRFIDVSNMWTERGEKQLEIPLGAKLELPEKPILATLTSLDAPWPDSAQTAEGVFSERGYRLKSSGLPVYFYALGQTKMEDNITATSGSEGLIRSVKVTPGAGKTAYLLLAEGSAIEPTSNGGYAVDDKRYYIENLQTGSLKPILRHNSGRQQLILPIQNQPVNIQYNIIW